MCDTSAHGAPREWTMLRQECTWCAELRGCMYAPISLVLLRLVAWQQVYRFAWQRVQSVFPTASPPPQTQPPSEAQQHVSCESASICGHA